MMQEYIRKVVSGTDLTRKEAASAMDLIMSGKATPSQISGLVIALKMKGERPDEVAGFVESMRHHAVKIQVASDNAVDGVGTGGDGSHSFNISTAAALVASAAGVTVAKHGNRSVSSRCGSADLLEAMGGKVDTDHDLVRRAIDEIGFGFMFAPRFHPAMRHAAEPRRDMGVRTVFNILGPLTNPAGVKRLLVGVYDKTLMPLMADVLNLTGGEHVLIVHSQDGMDELSVSAPTDYLEMRNGRISTGILSPEEAGVSRHPFGALAGGDPEENAAIFRDLLNGAESAYRDAVLLNAGALLYIAGESSSIAEGTQLAKAAIDEGSARAKMAAWIEFTNS